MPTTSKTRSAKTGNASPEESGRRADLHNEAIQRDEAKHGADRHDALVALLREKVGETLDELTPEQALRCYLQAFALRFKKEIRAGLQETIMQEELELFRKKAEGTLDTEP